MVAAATVEAVLAPVAPGSVLVVACAVGSVEVSPAGVVSGGCAACWSVEVPFIGGGTVVQVDGLLGAD